MCRATRSFREPPGEIPRGCTSGGRNSMHPNPSCCTAFGQGHWPLYSPGTAVKRRGRALHRGRHRSVAGCRPSRAGADSSTRRRRMKWVTRECPKIDRIACPWLIARFIDQEPEFL